MELDKKKLIKMAEVGRKRRLIESHDENDIFCDS